MPLPAPGTDGPLPSLADLAALEIRLGYPLDDNADADRAQAALDDVSALVRLEAGRTWLDDSQELTEVPSDVVGVVCAVALRAFRNPEGYSSETIGDYSWRAADGTTVGMFLTETEQRIVRRYGATRRGLWTMSTAATSITDAAYVPSENPAADSIPMFATGHLGDPDTLGDEVIPL